jgi:hypothetical protein
MCGFAQVGFDPMCGLSRIVCPYKYSGHRDLSRSGHRDLSRSGHRDLSRSGRKYPMPNNTFATSEHLILSHFAQAEYFLDFRLVNRLDKQSQRRASYAILEPLGGKPAFRNSDVLLFCQIVSIHQLTTV